MLRKLSSAGYVRCVVRLAQPQTLKSCGFITNHVRLECHTTAFRHQIRFLSTDLPDVDTNKLTQLGKQYFDNNKYSEAEAALRKAAANNDSEAQFQLGLLLTTPTPLSKDATPAAVSSTAAEVKDEIKKLRKESLMAKQVQSGSVAAFQKALNKRKDQQGNSQLDSIKVEHSTAKQRKGIEIAGQAREKEGLVWMKAAAEQGHTNAMCYLGNHLLATAQTQLNELAVQDMPVQSVHKSKEQACKQIAEAISHYERAALLNNATAAFNLGVLYYDGITCDMPPATVMQKPNSENPVSNAHSAATTSAPPEITVSKVSNRQKRQEAQDEAAAAQSKPVKVDIVCVDLARSLLYFEQAAALHEPTAALWCGYCYANEEGGVESHEVSGGKALSYLTAAAQHPDTSAKAHFYLSQIYYSGCKGTERSGADAVALNIGMFVQHLRQAVAGHDEDALKCLADLHLQYVGLPSAEQSEVDSSEEADTSKILVLLNDDLHAAAEASACHHEGCGHDHHNHQHHDHHHHHHHDHKQDHQHEHQADKHLRRAVVLFEQASAAGQATATLTLGALTYQGVIHSTAGVADKRRAFELYNLAAEQGSLDAWRNLASMYYLGDGVPKSEVTAREIMKVMFGKKPSTI